MEFVAGAGFRAMTYPQLILLCIGTETDVGNMWSRESQSNPKRIGQINDCTTSKIDFFSK